MGSATVTPTFLFSKDSTVLLQDNYSFTPSPLSIMNTTNISGSGGKSSTYNDYGMAFVVPMCLVLSVAIALALGGNIMVILTIFKHKNMRTRTNMFIVSLSVADILVAVCDMPFSIVTLIAGDWVMGDAFCEFNSITMSLFMVASVQTLMFISIHKYISITRPFSRYMTPKRILVMITVTWVWSFTYAIGGAAGWTENEYKKGASQCGPTYPKSVVQLSHSVCNTLLNLLLPIMVTCFCYTKIFCEIRSHLSRMREMANLDRENSLRQQKQISVTLLVVLICFLTCWSPYIFYSCYAAFIKNKASVPVIANPLAYWCGYINSACNPIIYAFRSKSFRKGYYSIVCGEQPRSFNSGGSFSQRSPSSFRKKGSLRTALHIGTNGESASGGVKAGRVIASDHKHRTKRLVSMNSWASISFSATPFRKTSTKEAFRRQDSVESQATARPLLKSCSESPVSPNPPSTKSNGTLEAANGPNFSPNDVAETSLTVLSPIQEGSIEDLPAGCNRSSVGSVEFNNERNRLLLAKKVKDAIDITCNVAFLDCQTSDNEECPSEKPEVEECLVAVNGCDGTEPEFTLSKVVEQSCGTQRPKEELIIETSPI